MSYSALAVTAVVAVLVVDLAVYRTRMVTRRVFWTAYAIVIVFQLLMNGVLTGLDVVVYDPDAIWGPRIAYAPVEDLLFGFALVVLGGVAGVPAGHLPHRLQGEHGAHRDDEEEQQLLDRDATGQPDAERALGAVVPVAGSDRVEHPGDEDDELRNDGEQQPPPPRVDPHPQHDLQRGRDHQAADEDRQVGQVPHRRAGLRTPVPGPGG